MRREASGAIVTSFLSILAGALAGVSVFLPASVPAQASASWTHAGATAARVSSVSETPPPLDAPVWVLDENDAGQPISWLAQSSPVVADGRVYALGTITGSLRLISADALTGQFLWAAPVKSSSGDSWSSPAIDSERKQVLVASGDELRAIDADDGTPEWTAFLSRDAVNASPLVTDDLAHDRAFITDADPFGADGRLYCVNVAPFDAIDNPFVPGEIVWSVPLGSTNGNTPAYDDGVVYVATNGVFGFGPGEIHAYDAAATSAPAPLWTFVNVTPEGFFGGVCIDDDHVYGATYAFFGGQSSANLVKLDADDGSLEWSIPCNRTDSIPIPLADGRIVLSTGIDGFGSVPAVQLFQDHGASATLLWDSATATWHDDNSNAQLDPGEYLELGGWTHQPTVTRDNGATMLLVGSDQVGAGQFGPNSKLRLIDLDLHPTHPSFVFDAFDGAGGDPSFASGAVYSIGPGGLHAFVPSSTNYDVNEDGLIDIDDLYSWHQGDGLLDVNGDTVVDGDDGDDLERELRKDELDDMSVQLPRGT